MQSVRFVLVAVLLVSSLSGTAQSTADENKAMAYYLQADEAIGKQDWDKALPLLQKAEDLLGKKTAVVEAAKVKIYYNTNQYQKAKSSLDSFFKMNASTGLLEEMSSYMIKIEEKLEAQKLAEEQRREEERIAREKREEERRIALQKKQEEERLRQEKAVRFEPEIKRRLSQFLQIEEGKPYFIRNTDPQFTDAGREMTIIVFYGNKYIAWTIPDRSFIESLRKDQVSFSQADVDKDDFYIDSEKFGLFAIGPTYSNIAVGGKGDYLLWRGDQYQTFDQTLYYYYKDNKFTYDVKWPMPEKPANSSANDKRIDLQNLHVQIGTLDKVANYDFIIEQEVTASLKKNGFNEVRSYGVDKSMNYYLDGLAVAMVIPSKKIDYKIEKTNLKVYRQRNGYKRAKSFFHYCKPVSKNNQYSFSKYGQYKTYGPSLFKDFSLVDNLERTKGDFKLDGNSFIYIYNSIYEADEKKVYATQSGIIYETIFKLIEGN